MSYYPLTPIISFIGLLLNKRSDTTICLLSHLISSLCTSKKKKSIQKGLCESEKALGNGSNLQPLHHQQIRWFDLLQGKMFTSLQFDYKGILGCDAWLDHDWKQYKWLTTANNNNLWCLMFGLLLHFFFIKKIGLWIFWTDGYKW